MKKSKTISLLKGIENGDWWGISVTISDIGEITEKGKFQYRNDEATKYNKRYHKNHKESNKKYNKQYYESHLGMWKQYKQNKQYIKTFTLLSGMMEGTYWSVRTEIKEDGKFRSKGHFQFVDRIRKVEERRKYNREYGRKHKSMGRYLILDTYYEEGYTIQLRQAISRKGKIYGIGSFLCNRNPNEAKNIEQQHRGSDLILLNKYFPKSELHHLSNIYGIFIPKGLHRSIPHNLKTGKNMDKINDRALKYGDLNINKNKEGNYFK